MRNITILAVAAAVASFAAPARAALTFNALTFNAVVANPLVANGPSERDAPVSAQPRIEVIGIELPTAKR